MNSRRDRNAEDLRSATMPKTKSQPLAAPVQASGKIGLWGAPGSGKTTYLAALSIAANRKQERLQLFGADDASTDFLIQQTALLTRDMLFPPATDAERHLNWVLRMNVDGPGRRFWRSAPETTRVEFELDFLDAPGGRYADTREASRGADPAPRRLFGDEDPVAAVAGTVGNDEQFLQELAGCDGLVLLFDPTREWETSDAFNHFHGTLLKIAQRRMRDPGRTTDLLPQYVAVCTTKFDHNDVYRKACELGFRSFSITDRRFFPKISDDRAEQFFIAMGRESERSNADLVRSTLRNFFEGDRIQFFVSSAIGFRIDHASGQFDEQEFENIDDRSGPVPRIKGPVYPINVIEPLMWLGEKLAGER
jgi:hypothetical protein